MSFCYKKILGVFTHLRVTTPNIIEPKKSNFLGMTFFLFLRENSLAILVVASKKLCYTKAN